MKKILSLVVSGIVASSLMVGCSNKETAKETVIIKHQDEQGNIIKEKEVTKEEAQEIKEQNKSEVTKEKANNKSEVKKESKTYQQSNKTYQQSKKNKENSNKEYIKYCVTCNKEINTKNGYSFDEEGIKCKNCIHKCINCGQQMKELEKDNFYCINPNCVSYTNPNKEKEEPEEHPVDYVKCPNCGNPIVVNEYGNGTCNGCGLNYFPGCIKKGTELDKVEHEEEQKSDDIVEEQN